MTGSTAPAGSSRRPILDLFLISSLILFLELACIRWFPAHVLLLTFFTNVVLLACFLGMSVGCLAAASPRRYLSWTPLLLAVGLAAAHVAAMLRARLPVTVNVGSQRTNPQLVFFGAEYEATDADHFVIPMEVILGFFFVVIALLMIGPGQELGRALARLPNRVLAYSADIAGSLAGIVLFTLFSYFELSPFYWFLPVAVVVACILAPRPFSGRPVWRWALQASPLIPALLMASFTSEAPWGAGGTTAQHLVHWMKNQFGRDESETEAHFTSCFWSPYYRVDYVPAPKRTIEVNLIGHQQMNALDKAAPGNALPYLFNRDGGGKQFKNVLIIGAGSGNDVSRALQWGAEHVDAVEIDPVIQRLGARDHPNHPYQDPRVTVHLDDGRNFLRSAAPEKYDLVIYALVDSLVLHSSFSNIRLESYLFTSQAYRDVRRCLKPDGLFAMYNFYRQGWIVARLVNGLDTIFGDDNPLVFTLPYQDAIREDSTGGFTLILAGGNDPIRRGFQTHHAYWISANGPTGPDTPNGFHAPPGPPEDWLKFGPAEIVQPRRPLPPATDDWPFLYLRRPMIPGVSLGGAAVMGGLALAMILTFLPRDAAAGGWRKLDGRMFFLGAGFMLIETKAVVHMALLFGSTWKVNSFVFFAVLSMILAANLFVLRIRPKRLWPFYIGLLASLGLNLAFPLDAFLGIDRTLQVVGSGLLVFAPILFAGVIFATAFARTEQADLAFGANIAGAMLGGLSEYASMLIGFQGLLWVAAVFYLLSWLLGRNQSHVVHEGSSGATV